MADESGRIKIEATERGIVVDVKVAEHAAEGLSQAKEIKDAVRAAAEDAGVTIHDIENRVRERGAREVDLGDTDAEINYVVESAGIPDGLATAFTTALQAKMRERLGGYYDAAEAAKLTVDIVEGEELPEPDEHDDEPPLNKYQEHINQEGIATPISPDEIRNHFLPLVTDANLDALGFRSHDTIALSPVGDREQLLKQLDEALMTQLQELLVAFKTNLEDDPGFVGPDYVRQLIVLVILPAREQLVHGLDKAPIDQQLEPAQLRQMVEYQIRLADAIHNIPTIHPTDPIEVNTVLEFKNAVAGLPQGPEINGDVTIQFDGQEITLSEAEYIPALNSDEVDTVIDTVVGAYWQHRTDAAGFLEANEQFQDIGIDEIDTQDRFDSKLIEQARENLITIFVVPPSLSPLAVGFDVNVVVNSPDGPRNLDNTLTQMKSLQDQLSNPNEQQPMLAILTRLLDDITEQLRGILETSRATWQQAPNTHNNDAVINNAERLLAVIDDYERDDEDIAFENLVVRTEVRGVADNDKRLGSEFVKFARERIEAAQQVVDATRDKIRQLQSEVLRNRARSRRNNEENRRLREELNQLQELLVQQVEQRDRIRDECQVAANMVRHLEDIENKVRAEINATRRRQRFSQVTVNAYRAMRRVRNGAIAGSLLGLGTVLTGGGLVFGGLAAVGGSAAGASWNAVREYDVARDVADEQQLAIREGGAQQLIDLNNQLIHLDAVRDAQVTLVERFKTVQRTDYPNTEEGYTQKMLAMEAIWREFTRDTNNGTTVEAQLATLHDQVENMSNNRLGAEYMDEYDHPGAPSYGERVRARREAGKEHGGRNQYRMSWGRKLLNLMDKLF